MADGLHAKMVQSYLVMLNVVFLIIGTGILIVGSWLVVDQNVLVHLKHLGTVREDEMLHLAAYVLLTLGGVTFLLALTGCCGAVRESTCLLSTYCVVLLALVVIESSAAILLYIFRARVEVLIIRSLQEQLLTRYGDNNTVGLAWNTMQKELSCCGVLSFSEWMDSKWFHKQQSEGNSTRLYVPWSCCIASDVTVIHNCTTNTTSLTMSDVRHTCQEEARLETYKSLYLNREGCFDKLIEWFREQSKIFIATAVCIGILQLLGAIAAAILIRKVKDKNMVVPINIVPSSLY